MELPHYIDQRYPVVKSTAVVLQERVKDLVWNFSCVEEGMSTTHIRDSMKSIQFLVDDLWREVNNVLKFSRLGDE